MFAQYWRLVAILQFWVRSPFQRTSLKKFLKVESMELLPLNIGQTADDPKLYPQEAG